MVDGETYECVKSFCYLGDTLDGDGGADFERPRRTWLEILEADMAELEIDKEDVHDRKKWRENVMKRKSNPIEKWTINR